VNGFHFINQFIEIINMKNIENIIKKECDLIKNILLDKNRKYGNSALKPLRIFSKLDDEQQLFVRIDDKLSRISNQNKLEDEDVILDLIGYLILLKIKRRIKNEKTT